MTAIFGILNVTPDSFSDGGQYFDAGEAIARGIELRDQGADFVDVGGESTRPGADPVDASTEQSRVIPVINGLVAAGVTVSIDTMNADTALAAADAGASVINDVSGGLADPGMYAAAASTGLRYVAMHWRGTHDVPDYDDVVTDVVAALRERLDALAEAGVDPDKVVLDPGLGFAKSGAHNWQLLARLDEVLALGHPVLIGASRKRFLGELLAADAPTNDRDLPTAVTSALAARVGAWAVRVHDVPSTRIALDTLSAWQNGIAR